MNIARHSTASRLSFNLLPAFLALLLIASVCPAADIRDISPFTDTFGSGNILELDVQPEADSEVRLYRQSSLDGTTVWTVEAGPVWTTPTASPFHFSVAIPPGSSNGFFRLEEDVFTEKIHLLDDGETMDILIRDHVPVPIFFSRISQLLGLDVFPVEDPKDTDLIPPQHITGPNIEALLDALVMPSWVAPPKEDDAKYAGRFDAQPVNQGDPLPDDPNDEGRGEIEDGWEGDEIKEIPEEGRSDPEVPNQDGDMPFVVEIPDVPEGLLQKLTPLPDTFHHYRVSVDIDAENGRFKLGRTDFCPGKALLPAFSPPPPLGGLVVVVKSRNQKAHDGIFHIGVMDDPFLERSYDPPHDPRASHGTVERPVVEGLRFAVPLFQEGTEYEDLTIQVFRYVRSGEFDLLLDPDAFLQNPKSFESLGEITGGELSGPGMLNATSGEVIVAAPPAADPTFEQLHYAGSRSEKFNFVIIGDGFANNNDAQQAFNDYIQNTVVDQFITRDVHPEILNAMNIFRINTYSTQSGVTTVNATGGVVTVRNSALEYRYSGNWNRCWMEPGPNTQTLINQTIAATVPEADAVAIVLNVTSGGGCARGTHFAVTRASSWATFAHEFGHFFGQLQDEYQCNSGSAGCGTYTGGEPTVLNQTRLSTWNNLKWKNWVPSYRPLPTARTDVADTDQDVGLFPGGTRGNNQWWTGIYRPSWRGRMNNNTPEHNPVGYSAVRERARPRQESDFRKTVSGDFNGDGLTDLVMLDDRQLSLYLADERDVGPDDPIRGSPPRSVTGVLAPTWFHTDILYNAARTRSWQFRKGDQLFPADFDGDGLDDLYVVNLTNWNQSYLCMLKSFGDYFEPVKRYDTQLPGWDAMRSGDQFHVGDLNGDGRDDFMVFNGTNWNMPYFLLLRSTGTRLAYMRRYDRYLPVWEMGRHERFHVGDFNGDGLDDLLAQNRDDWNQVHLQVQVSSGSGLQLGDRHYGTVGGSFWTMRRKDVWQVVNFNGGDGDELAVFNGFNWGPVYLGLFGFDDASMFGVRRYDDDTSPDSQNNPIPGWQMRRRDRFRTANVDGDGDEDLVVYNSDNWSTQYLGMLRSDGRSRLTGRWQRDRIGAWNLSSADDFHVADFRGNGQWVDLYVYNAGWFGLLRSYQNHYKLEAIYRKWIHNHRYHRYGWW